MTGTASRTTRSDRAHRGTQINFLREVKVDSPIHRMWAGSKIIAIAGISFTAVYYPTWGSLGLLTALLLLTTFAAHIPRGAWPRPPLWFWLTVIAAGLLASIAGGSPYLELAGTKLGLGGLDAYARFVATGMLLLLGAAVLGWTTSLADIAPAISSLLRPLRLVAFPVDEVAASIALSVRSLPLLVGEMRALLALRKLRPQSAKPGLSSPERRFVQLVDLLVAALAVSVRRSGEMAEAITARGGVGAISTRTRRAGSFDVAALVVLAAVCYAASSFPT